MSLREITMPKEYSVDLFQFLDPKGAGSKA